jgi:hypothetical protein
MRLLSCVASTVLLVAATASAETASASLVVAAHLNSRTSLHVSDDLLRFDVTAVDQPATASVDFSAAARTAAGAQVVLSVEPVQEMQGPSGPSEFGASLTFSGIGEGTLAGTVAPSSLTPAGRWTGSGLRHGRLVFALRASISGSYSIPVRFVLSAP